MRGPKHCHSPACLTIARVKTERTKRGEAAGRRLGAPRGKGGQRHPQNHGQRSPDSIPVTHRGWYGAGQRWQPQHPVYTREHPRPHPPTPAPACTHGGGNRPHRGSLFTPPQTRGEQPAVAQGKGRAGSLWSYFKFPSPSPPPHAQAQPGMHQIFFPPPARMLKISHEGRPATPQFILPFVSQQRRGGWKEKRGESR